MSQRARAQAAALSAARAVREESRNARSPPRSIFMSRIIALTKYYSLETLRTQTAILSIPDPSGLIDCRVSTQLYSIEYIFTATD